ncbi:MAG: 2-oxoglutarate dehydrogenase E1 subunit family protein, partial [Actinomycetales bacterium]
MSQSRETTETNALNAFGANEWLVDEMYQRYLEDPTSVDRAWWDFFGDYAGNGAAPAVGGADGATAPVSTPAPNGGAPAAPAAPGSTPSSTPTTNGPTSSPAAPPKPATAAAAAAATPAPTPSAVPAPPVPPTKPAPQPSAGPKPGAAEDGSDVAPLRGAAARVVSNMEASLSVPTATSVRAVPAKLLADNRIVINNHLRRGRGGKVSFTHLIGYAVVQAVAAMPEM